MKKKSERVQENVQYFNNVTLSNMETNMNTILNAILYTPMLIGVFNLINEYIFK
jgi:hypothetical protein